MINKKASVRFTDKAHKKLNYLINNNIGTVSSIINQLLENIDLDNLYSTNNTIYNKNKISVAYTELMNLITYIPDDELKVAIMRKMEEVQCLWLR